MIKPKRGNTILTGASTGTEADAEKALTSLPRWLVHARGALEEPMWPTLAAFEVADLTRIEPDDIKALADLGWMPAACFIREGDRFAFRATAVAWAYAYLFTSLGTGLAAIMDDDRVVDFDMVARPAQAAETRTWLARLSPEILHTSFLIEILKPGGLSRLKYDFEFELPIAMAAGAWEDWLAEQAGQDKEQSVP